MKIQLFRYLFGEWGNGSVNMIYPGAPLGTPGFLQLYSSTKVFELSS